MKRSVSTRRSGRAKDWLLRSTRLADRAAGYHGPRLAGFPQFAALREVTLGGERRVLSPVAVSGPRPIVLLEYFLEISYTYPRFLAPPPQRHDFQYLDPLQ